VRYYLDFQIGNLLFDFVQCSLVHSLVPRRCQFLFEELLLPNNFGGFRETLSYGSLTTAILYAWIEDIGEFLRKLRPKVLK